MKQPKVTVVMCTYNGALFLTEQLNSILHQTYPISEWLVFDDFSTDGTMQLLENFRQKHPIMKVHQNSKHIGFNANFEQALRAASGDVIAIADQDDIWLPQKIEKKINSWNPEYPVIYCTSLRFNTEDRSQPALRNPIFFQGTDARKLLFANTISGHSLLIRREFLQYILPFPEKVFYDWWIAFIAAQNGGVDLVQEPLVWHRMHRENVSVYKAQTTKQSYAHRRAEIIRHMEAFMEVPYLSSEVEKIGRAFLKGLTNRSTLFKKSKLFFLILQNRHRFFYTMKRKPTLFFSHLKYAFYWAFY